MKLPYVIFTTAMIVAGTFVNSSAANCLNGISPYVIRPEMTSSPDRLRHLLDFLEHAGSDYGVLRSQGLIGPFYDNRTDDLATGIVNTAEGDVELGSDQISYRTERNPSYAAPFIEAVRCLLGGAGTAGAPAIQPDNGSTVGGDGSSAGDDASEQERDQKIDSTAEASVDSVLGNLDDATPSGKRSSQTRPKKQEPKGYKSAVGCIRVLQNGPGFFSNVLGNSCAYKVSISYCTVSARGTGSFNCQHNQFGGDSIGPGGSQAIMGGGVPAANDPFQVLYTACEFPGIPMVTKIHAKSLEFVCR